MEQAVDAGAGADAAAVSADPDAGGRVNGQEETKAASTSRLCSRQRQKERTLVISHSISSGIVVLVENLMLQYLPSRSLRYPFLLVSPKVSEAEEG